MLGWKSTTEERGEEFEAAHDAAKAYTEENSEE